MENRNRILFFLFSLAILIGWMQLQVIFNPPKPPAPPEPPPAPHLEPHLARVLSALGSGPGLGPLVAAAQLPLPPAPVVEVKRPEPPPEEKEPAEEAVVLGGDGFKIQAKLTTRGGGVRELTLTQFDGANSYGLPTGQHLQLIHPSPIDSYLLYHYQPGEDARESRPLDTLGWRMWHLESSSLQEDQHHVVFSRDVPGLDVRLTKTFTVKKGDYHLGLTVKVESTRAAGQPEHAFRYQLAGAHGLPIEGVWYTSVYRNALTGWIDSSGQFWRNLEDARTISHRAGGERLDRGDKTIRYAAVANQFFTSALAVDLKEHQPSGKDNFIEWVRATLVGPTDPNQPFLDDITVRATTEEINLKPGTAVEHKYVLYNGPVKVRLLGLLEGDRAIATPIVDFYETSLNLNTLTDYPSPGWMGSFASTIGLTFLIIKFTNLMHYLLWALHQAIVYYGLCIIALTVLVRSVMFPISRKQAASTQQMQEKMQKLNPELKKLKEKYKDDTFAFGQAQQELFRRHGVNPFSTLGGCLLLFAQMPIFLGLYYCLQESIFLRLDRFLWMPNLAAPDMLFWWGEQIPLISNPADLGSFLYLGPYFNLLPVVAVALMLVQQKYMAPPAPSDDPNVEFQKKMMKFMMIFFGIMFYKVAAGLCIYFIASSLWGLAERKFLPKSKLAAAAEGPAAAAAASRGRPEEQKSAEATGVWRRVKNWWGEMLASAAKDPMARRPDGSPPPPSRGPEPRPPKKKRR